jgi:uncharacterized protein (TIGR04222 family)
MTAGHPVTPSVQVDEAWHLHLTFTRSYWVRLCGQVLGRPLHHDPTRGGDDESAKFHEQYERTLASYRKAFGQSPPADIWPPAEVRFGDDLDSLRVNTAHNWVVPKRPVLRTLAISATTVAAFASLGCGVGWSIEPTIIIQIIPFLFAFAVFVGLAVRFRLRGPGLEEDPRLSWEEAAYLQSLKSRGGVHRLVSATLTHLIARGAARVDPSGESIEPTGYGPSDLSPIEQEVHRRLPIARDEREKLKDIAERVELKSADIGQRLREAGYIKSIAQRLGVGWSAFLATVTTFAIPLLLLLGSHLGSHFAAGLLIVAIAAILIAGRLVGFVGLTPLTRRGSAALRSLRRSNREQRSADADSLAMGVALAGIDAIEGTSLDSLASWYPRTTIAAYSSCGTGCGTGESGGGDGGGGGGCGGGCGGCGGCGG